MTGKRSLGTAAPRPGLGERTRMLRQALRLSQQELADRAGISRRTVCGVEDGHIPRRDTLAKLARALRLDLRTYTRSALAAALREQRR